jgi:hypothetical protein
MSSRRAHTAVIVVALLVPSSTLPRAQEHHYIFTAAPLHLSIPSNPLCVAVDPDDPHGVWWWEPGTAGCRNRSTSGVLDAEQATVSRDASGLVEVSFRLQLHSLPGARPFVDLRLVLDEHEMRTPDSSVRVPTEARSDLAIPSAWGR